MKAEKRSVSPKQRHSYPLAVPGIAAQHHEIQLILKDSLADPIVYSPIQMIYYL